MKCGRNLDNVRTVRVSDGSIYKECFTNYCTCHIRMRHMLKIVNYLFYVETPSPGSEDCGWIDS
jgi:hypothetical protein